MNGYPNVGPKDPRVNADDGIRLRGDVEPPQCGPEKGARWDPYHQNVLKGDYPILGDHVFLELTGSRIQSGTSTKEAA